jgi:acyl-CoA reductase-like NAD-dependent aldehyde dehydrogenase
MQGFNLLINGRMLAGDSTMPVINPATEETLAECPRASVEQLNQAVAAAKEAFPAWAATPIDERRKVIAQIADAIEKNSAELARLLTPSRESRSPTPPAR